MGNEIHNYLVSWPHAEAKFTSRHYALQCYVARRKSLDDFADAKERVVRIFCDGTEYFNVDEAGAGRPVRAGSARQLTGTARAYPSETPMP